MRQQHRSRRRERPPQSMTSSSSSSSGCGGTGGGVIALALHAALLLQSPLRAASQKDGNETFGSEPGFEFGEIVEPFDPNEEPVMGILPIDFDPMVDGGGEDGDGDGDFGLFVPDEEETPIDLGNATTIIKVGDDPTPAPTTAEDDGGQLDELVTTTDSPTGRPTAAPVDTPQPTQAPVQQTVETGSPTTSPVAQPTSSAPTAAPAASPTTGSPVAAVTSPPTGGPTAGPTEADVIITSPPTTKTETDPPTSPPTAEPTSEPTAGPTAKPTEEEHDGPSETITVDNLVTELTAMDPMDGAVAAMWEDGTSTHVIQYWEAQGGLVKGLQVRTRLTGQTPAYSPSRRDRNLRGGWGMMAPRRSLQDGTVEVTYSQDISYTDLSSELDPEDLALQPFDRLSKRNAYIATLQDLPVLDAFEMLSEATLVQIVAPANSGGGDGGGGGGLSTLYIIVIACGGALLLLCAAGGYCRYAGKRKEASAGKKLGGGGGGPQDDGFEGRGDLTAYSRSNSYGNRSGGDPSSNNLSFGASNIQDDSTLQDPSPRLGVISSNESLAGYGDQSIATMDYDYSKAFGGGGEENISVAEGTLGDGTNTLGESVAHRTVGTLNGGGENGTVFTDDASLHGGGRAGEPIREELIDVYAPAGKLGVVIDTPDDGAPVVHAIKESSCVADKLRVGDKLVAVDNEDTRAMTAIKVSKMISRKSSNPTRKLTVIRSSLVE